MLQGFPVFYPIAEAGPMAWNRDHLHSPDQIEYTSVKLHIYGFTIDIQSIIQQPFAM